MNRACVDPIANAVLYEGYILYPYRPSTKNRQRWTFGGLYPESYTRARGAGDPSGNQTECLIAGTASTTLEVVVRFLHLTSRQAGELVTPDETWADGEEPPFRPVETLRAGEKLIHSWQEAEEREVALAEVTLGSLVGRSQIQPFAFAGGRRSEPVRGAEGEPIGILVRDQQEVEGEVEVSAVVVEEGLFRLTVRVVNRTPLQEAGSATRDEALLRALVSTHELLGVGGGAFVSLLDPPEIWREAASACKNVGTWPVLVGEEGQTDTMLSSPIILYDYPQVAPESRSDFFDGTEIDEILTLRVLTMTDEEKAAMAAVDERAGALLAKVEGMAREDMMALHGTVRGLRRLPGEDADG